LTSLPGCDDEGTTHEHSCSVVDRTHEVLQVEHEDVEPSFAGPASIPEQFDPHAFAMHEIKSVVAPSVPPAAASAAHPLSFAQESTLFNCA
jgi:hypothetical protein